MLTQILFIITLIQIFSEAQFSWHSSNNNNGGQHYKAECANYYCPSDSHNSPYDVSTTVCVCSVTQSYPTLCDPEDCSLPGSSVHWIFQARMLEWVAISSSRGSSWPRDQTWVSCVSCTGGGFFTTEPPGTPLLLQYYCCTHFMDEDTEAREAKWWAEVPDKRAEGLWFEPKDSGSSPQP